MNRTERTFAALRGEAVDRPPVSFWRHLDPTRDAVEQHVAFYRETAVDFIKVMHDGLPMPFESLEDALRLHTPTAYSRQAVERVKRVADALRGEAPVCLNVFSPFCLLRRLMPDETIGAMVRENPKKIIEAMARVGEELGRLCETLAKETDCFGIFLCYQGGEADRFDEETFHRVVRPSDRMVLDAANKALRYNIMHVCGWDERKNALERFVDYPSAAVNWATYVDEVSLPQGKTLFERTVMGGFDNRRGTLLYTGSREEIQREARRMVNDYRAQNGSLNGLIVGADCSFLPPIDSERFRWVVEAVMEVTQ